MPIPPDLAAIKEYLGSENLWTDAQVTAALASETAAQVRGIKLPADPVDETGTPIPQPYPADLTDALCRRVHHTLAIRALPFGVAATMTDGAVATNVVAGLDAEVRRLEVPYRRRTVA